MASVHGSSGDNSTLPLGQRIANLPSKAKEIFNSLKRNVTKEPPPDMDDDITFKVLKGDDDTTAHTSNEQIHATRETQSEVTTRFKNGLEIAYNQTIGKINFGKPDTTNLENKVKDGLSAAYHVVSAPPHKVQAKLDNKAKQLIDNFNAKEKACDNASKQLELVNNAHRAPSTYKAAIKEAKTALSEMHSARSKLVSFYAGDGKKLQTQNAFTIINLLQENGKNSNIRSNLSNLIDKTTITAAKDKFEQAAYRSDNYLKQIQNFNFGAIKNPTPEQVKAFQNLLIEAEKSLKDTKKAFSELTKILSKHQEGIPNSTIIPKLQHEVDEGIRQLRAPLMQERLKELFPGHS